MTNSLAIGASRSRFSECKQPKDGKPERKEFVQPPKEEVEAEEKKAPRPIPESFIDVEFPPSD